MLLLHYAVDVLDHHYRVVHDYSDGEHEAEQGHGVQREAENQHHAEGAYQGDGHGYRRNHGGAPVLQREEHHENHEQQSLEQGLVDFMDRLRDVVGHVEGDVVGDSVGEAFANLGHRRLHVLGDLHRVGSGEHQHVDHRRVLAVDSALRVI